MRTQTCPSPRFTCGTTHTLLLPLRPSATMRIRMQKEYAPAWATENNEQSEQTLSSIWCSRCGPVFGSQCRRRRRFLCDCINVHFYVSTRHAEFDCHHSAHRRARNQKLNWTNATTTNTQESRNKIHTERAAEWGVNRTKRESFAVTI